METSYLGKNTTLDEYDVIVFRVKNETLIKQLNDTQYGFDYEKTPYLGEIKRVPLLELVVKIVIYPFIICLAVAGNILIIIVVAKNTRMRTTTNFYIVNLAVSDLLVTLFCTWVKLVDNLTEEWVLGEFFCKVNSFAQDKAEQEHGDTDPVQVGVSVTENDSDYIDEVTQLRWYMRLYFFHPFKLKGDSLSFHFGYCGVFLLQIIKIILITVMLFRFGHDRSYFNAIVNRGHITLRNLMMKNWDATWETLPYPPAHGEFAVYTKDDILDRINYAVAVYYNIEKSAIGFFTRRRNDSIGIKMKYFDFEGFAGVSTDGIEIKEKNLITEKGLKLDTASAIYTYDIKTEFDNHNISQPIKKLLHLSLEFTLNSVRVFEEEEKALCLKIQGKLIFSDLDNNGQVLEDLETLTTKVKCEKINVHVKDWNLQRTSLGLAGMVVGLSFLSIVVTVLTLALAVYVLLRTKQFMKNNYQRFYKPINPDEKDLPMRQYLHFFKIWDLFSIFSDLATLYGTFSVAFRTDEADIDIALLDSFTVWLGVGCLIAWFSILRYFKFHIKFHLLFTTIYRAFGDVLAYVMCVGVLFIGFWACGYVVLGPYHVKFGTPEATTETLLAVVNGDEIFATLAILDVTKSENPTIWWFSRVFLWTYVAIFTIVVLNLLVAIVLSSYEVIKVYYEKKDDDRDLGPLEVALQELVENVRQSKFRQSLVDLINTDDRITAEESSLRMQLQRMFRTSMTQRDIVTILPKTIKVFMNEGVRSKEQEGCSIIMVFKPFSTEKTGQS